MLISSPLQEVSFQSKQNHFLSPGFARSFGMLLANGERREWIKPIMFSGGLGSIDDTHVKKEEAEPGSTLPQSVN